jgi:Protein of unknown function (DUF1573)
VARLRIPLILALGSVALASPAPAAGLAFERESIEVAAQPGQRIVHVEFPFRNSGDRPVTITSVETSCRCTSADTSKKTYAPGERDSVSVDFSVGGQEGAVVKTVTVATDGPELAPFTLTLRVDIPAGGAPK